MNSSNVIICIENPKESNPKNIRTNKQVQQYKINIQKSIAFLCTSNELSRSEIKKTVLLT